MFVLYNPHHAWEVSASRLTAVLEACAVDLSTFTRKWADVFPQADRNTAQESPPFHPRRFSTNVKTNHPRLFQRDSRKACPRDPFFSPLNLKACNPRACRNLIKTLCEWNCLRNLLYVLNRGRGNTWLGRICLGLLLCFTTWYIHLFTTQLTGLWHSLWGWGRWSEQQVHHKDPWKYVMCASTLIKK